MKLDIASLFVLVKVDRFAYFLMKERRCLFMFHQCVMKYELSLTLGVYILPKKFPELMLSKHIRMFLPKRRKKTTLED